MVLTVNVDISSDATKVGRAIERKMAKQLAFATSKAVNSTMEKTRDNELWRAYQKAFTVRNKTFFFKQLAAVFYSNKRQMKSEGMLIAAIQEKGLLAPPGSVGGRGKVSPSLPKMRLHVGGGTKTPTGGASKLAIPRKGAIKRGAKGRVLASSKPRSITSKKSGYRSGSYIFRKKRGKKRELVYSLKSSAQIKSAWNPHTVVKGAVHARFKNEFNRAWVRAIKTMRI